jgi:excisionase family DNA binding protein
MQDVELVPVGLAARILGVSEHYTRVLVDEGRIAGIRDASGRRLIKRADLERFAEERAALRASR